MSIPLPPLPDYVRLAAALGPIAANQLCVTEWKDGIDIEVPRGDVDRMFRARDQEIVRCVLQAAAMACKQLGPSEPNCVWEAAYRHVCDDCAAAIRALEFRHD